MALNRKRAKELKQWERHGFAKRRKGTGQTKGQSPKGGTKNLDNGANTGCEEKDGLKKEAERLGEGGSDTWMENEPEQVGRHGIGKGRRNNQRNRTSRQSPPLEKRTHDSMTRCTRACEPAFENSLPVSRCSCCFLGVSFAAPVGAEKREADDMSVCCHVLPSPTSHRASFRCIWQADSLI